jgi:ubiquinone/menaquinone biosynthesis C-methylase UbiE
MNADDLRELIEPAIAGRRWADFGCGNGNFTVVLSDLLGPEGEVWAVDRDARALERLRPRVGKRNIKLTHADFSHPLPDPERDLDGVLMANSLHFVKDQDKPAVVSQLAGLLKPQGRFLLVEYDTDNGNPWVPCPISFRTWRNLATSLDLSEPQRLATYPSRWSNQLYSALARKTSH